MPGCACNIRLSAALVLSLLAGSPPLLAQDGAAPNRKPTLDAVIPISQTLCNGMKERKVMNPGAPVGCDRLRLVQFGHVDFQGGLRNDGELVVLDAVAEHVLRIFVALRDRKFPIQSARLMNHFNGDDDASMAVNNTSAFNFRQVAGGGGISLHSYGVAIDLNPLQNPYVMRGARGLTFAPAAGKEYLNRRNLRPGMAEPVVEIFARHGLVEWGGHWRSPDYQHFQLSRAVTAQLVRLSPRDGASLFERYVERIRACLDVARRRGDPNARSCLAA